MSSTAGETDEQLAARLQCSFDAEAARHFTDSRTSPPRPPRRQLSEGRPAETSHRRTQSTGAHCASTSCPPRHMQTSNGLISHWAQSDCDSFNAGPDRASAVPTAWDPPQRVASTGSEPVQPPGRVASAPAAASPMATSPRLADPQRPANGLSIDDDVSDQDSCVVCLDARATTGFLHNDSVHRCCCGPCAEEVNAAQTKLCPVCRQPYSAVLKVF